MSGAIREAPVPRGSPNMHELKGVGPGGGRRRGGGAGVVGEGVCLPARAGQAGVGQAAMGPQSRALPHCTWDTSCSSWSGVPPSGTPPTACHLNNDCRGRGRRITADAVCVNMWLMHICFRSYMQKKKKKKKLWPCNRVICNHLCQ